MDPLKNFLERRTTGEMALIGVTAAVIVFAVGVQFGGGLAFIESLATN